MTAIGRAARTTLRTIGRDPGMLALLGVASVFYSLFYPTPYLHQVLRDVPVVVVDRDHTPMSRRFARWLDASEGVAVAGRSANLEAAQQAVRAGKLGGVVLIPTDFERHLLRREPATLTTYVDGSYLLVRSTLAGTVNTVAATLGAGITNRPAPLALASWPLFNPAGGYATFLVPAVFILVLQQTLLIGMGTLRVAERHSPVGYSGPVWARVGGIVTVLLVLYLVEAAIMFLVASRLYGLPLRADLPTAAVFLIPFITANVLLGLAIGELFERPESSTVALALTSVPALFLSGISFPLENQAAWARAIGLTLPTTFGIRGFVQIGEMGATLAEAWRSWGALWLQTLIYGLIAAYLMSRKRAGQVVAAACVLLASLPGSSLRAQVPPSPITFSSGSWQLTLGGYLKLDLIHDFDANGSPDTFDPRSIPVDGSKGTNTRIHARESRLSLGIKGPAEGRDLRLFVEGDFYGSGNAFRLRHAYAQYGVLLAGQTWTTVMDADNIPPTIDFETPLAAPFVRQGLLRITSGLSKRSDLAFAVEESDPEVLIPPGVQGTTEKPWPDFTTRFRFTGSRGHVQLSGFVGRTRFRAATGSTSDVTIGGVLVSTRLSLFDRDTTYLQVAYGPGVGRYRGAASAALDAAGRLRTVDVVGVTAGYLHYWSPRWSSNVVVSPAWVTSELGDPATSNDSFNYVAVNLLYWLIDRRAWVGGEYLYGRRELRNGVHGSDSRVQLATCFNI